MRILREAAAFKCGRCKKLLLLELINENKHNRQQIMDGISSTGDLLYDIATKNTISEAKKKISWSAIPVLTRRRDAGMRRCNKCQEELKVLKLGKKAMRDMTCDS